MATPLPRDPIADAQRNWERHGWGDVAAPMAAVTAIMRTQQILLARIEGALKPFGLTFARYELLELRPQRRAADEQSERLAPGSSDVCDQRRRPS